MIYKKSVARAFWFHRFRGAYRFQGVFVFEGFLGLGFVFRVFPGATK